MIPWILALVIITLLCLLVGVAVQQSYRMSANDPQIQIAEDMATAFANNQFTEETLKSSVEAYTPTTLPVNIGTSLAPWIQVYTQSGEPLFSSALISDAQSVPHVPKGIFERMNKQNEVRVTWQPKRGIRQAIVVTKFTGVQNGFIVVGRSLKEVEVR